MSQSLRIGTLSFPSECVVCYEQFEGSRYPVVLPCGHTFVCASCANKLKKCTECHRGLVISPSCDVPVLPELNLNEERGIQFTRRYSFDNFFPAGIPQRGNFRQPLESGDERSHQNDLNMLPLPKNSVLCSIIEASKELTKKKSLENNGKFNYDNLGRKAHPDLIEHLSATLNEVTIDVAQSTSKSCGTYLVLNDKGLQIEREKPDSYKEIRNVKLPPLQERMKPSTHIPCNEKIQIVDFDFTSGCGKLARNEGYVANVDPSLLIRVGEAEDDACKIEAELCSLQLLKNDMKRRLAVLEAHEQTLESNLKEAVLVEFTPSPDLINQNPTTPPRSDVFSQCTHTSLSGSDMLESVDVENSLQSRIGRRQTLERRLFQTYKQHDHQEGFSIQRRMTQRRGSLPCIPQNKPVHWEKDWGGVATSMIQSNMNNSSRKRYSLE